MRAQAGETPTAPQSTGWTSLSSPVVGWSLRLGTSLLQGYNPTSSPLLNGPSKLQGSQLQCEEDPGNHQDLTLRLNAMKG
jgi:hypothetical protein